MWWPMRFPEYTLMIQQEQYVHQASFLTMMYRMMMTQPIVNI